VKRLFELLLVARLLFPFFNSPLSHLYSDPQRHWDNAALFLHPNIMGANDPYLYQLWLFVARWLSNGHAAPVQLSCGLWDGIARCASCCRSDGHWEAR